MFFVCFSRFFCCCTCFQKKLKIVYGGGWVVSGQSEFFSDFLIFSNMTKPLTHVFPLIAIHTHKTGDMLGKCWPNVFDADPTLTQHWDNVLCFLGRAVKLSLIKIGYL